MLLSNTGLVPVVLAFGRDDALCITSRDSRMVVRCDVQVGGWSGNAACLGQYALSIVRWVCGYVCVIRFVRFVR